MPAPLELRPLQDDEAKDLRTLAYGRKVEARLRDRARICWLAHQGRRVTEISATVGVGHRSVRHWIQRFNAEGLAGRSSACSPLPQRSPTKPAARSGYAICGGGTAAGMHQRHRRTPARHWNRPAHWNHP